jgi:hypothetical protein
MAKTRKLHFIDAGRIESPIFESNEEVQREFEEAAQIGSPGQHRWIAMLREHLSAASEPSEIDIDATSEEDDEVEEAGSDEDPTLDQNNVEELARALGLTYKDNEPLQSSVRILARDQFRWELDPASSEGYQARRKYEGDYDVQKRNRSPHHAVRRTLTENKNHKQKGRNRT